jgi:hypothetical protein
MGKKKKWKFKKELKKEEKNQNIVKVLNQNAIFSMFFLVFRVLEVRDSLSLSLFVGLAYQGKEYCV